MRYLISVLGVILLVVPATDGFALEPTPGFPAIQRAFLREDFPTVAGLAQAFVAQNPNVPETGRVWMWLALSLDRLQRSTEALNELDHLKVRLPDDDSLWPEVLFWEGDVSRRAGQMIRAKLAYQRLLDRYPDSSWAAQSLMGMGLIYLDQQAFEIAGTYFHAVAQRQAASSGPLDAQLLEGLCQLQVERFQRAVDLLQPLVARLRNSTGVAQAAFYLGESFTGLKRYEEAVQAYQQAIAADESSSWAQLAQFGLGWARYQLTQCEESLRAFDAYLGRLATAPSQPPAIGGRMPPDDYRTEALFAQGGCLMQLGRTEDALSRFEQILTATPGHPLAVDSGLIIADLYRSQERFAEAKQFLHELLRQPLDDVSLAKIQLRLGTLALDQDNAPQARTLFELAGARDDPAIRQAALSGLGDVQMFLGDADAATPWYTQAIAALPEGPLAAYGTYQLGRIRLQAGAFEEAGAIFQRVVDGHDPALADEAKLALVLVHLSRREEPLARAQLEAIRREHPKSALAGRAAYYLALLTLGHENGEAARALCQDTITLAPKTDEATDARLMLADLLAQRTSVEDAIAWLRELYASAAVRGRHRAKLAKRLGDLHRAQQRYAEAIRWYEASAGLWPALDAETSYRIASCYEDAGDLELAMRWYAHIRQPPWRVRGQLALAKLLERQDRMQEAAAIYERLAAEPVPEAKVSQERLTLLRGKPQ